MEAQQDSLTWHMDDICRSGSINLSWFGMDMRHKSLIVSNPNYILFPSNLPDWRVNRSTPSRQRALIITVSLPASSAPRPKDCTPQTLQKRWAIFFLLKTILGEHVFTGNQREISTRRESQNKSLHFAIRTVAGKRLRQIRLNFVLHRLAMTSSSIL
jgi:hypothetical protein